MAKRIEPNDMIRCQNKRTMDITKGDNSFRQLVGGHGSRYPLKKCVTTYQPNELSLKMDGALTFYLFISIVITFLFFTKNNDE